MIFWLGGVVPLVCGVLELGKGDILGFVVSGLVVSAFSHMLSPVQNTSTHRGEHAETDIACTALTNLSLVSSAHLAKASTPPASSPPLRSAPGSPEFLAAAACLPSVLAGVYLFFALLSRKRSVVMKLSLFFTSIGYCKSILPCRPLASPNHRFSSSDANHPSTCSPSLCGSLALCRQS